jgi:hypothetical protein
MAPRGTILPRAQVRKMLATAKQTSLDIRRAELEGYERRRSDPFERAKLALQRAGRAVFSHSLLCPDSTLIVVGTQTMTRDELLNYAERFGRW